MANTPQTSNMSSLKSSLQTTKSAKMPKTVAFTRFAPEVRVIPDYMSTWAVGEESLTATPWQEANADRLWRESYAQATAMEEEDADAAATSASDGPFQDYFSSKPSYFPSSNAGPRIPGPATPDAPKSPQHRRKFSFEKHTPPPPPVPPRPTTSAAPIKRKPLPTQPQRYNTVPHPVQVQVPRNDSVHHTYPSPPSYARTSPSNGFVRPPLNPSRSAHQFSDFLAPHEQGNEHTDLKGRRDSYHPFEVFAKKTLKMAKKEVGKVRKVVEERGVKF